MLAQTDVMAGAQGEADRVLQEAHEQAEAVRAEVEDYVDAKLANFEIVLTKTLRGGGARAAEAVRRPRARRAARGRRRPAAAAGLTALAAPARGVR